MPTLSIKNAPDTVVLALRERARRNHRSLQGELMSIVTEAVSDDPTGPADIEAIMAEIRATGYSSPNESAAMIREDRDSDHGRR